MLDEQSIFLKAIELPPGDERERWLREACDNDLALRARIEELLLRHAEDSGFLEPQPAAMPATVALDSSAEDLDQSTQETFVGPPGAPSPPPETVRPGSLVRYIGDYEILSEIARGGMGVVYKARQVRLKRIVALKMILSGEFGSGSDIRRFHTEAESAARLAHPRIVPVYEVGEHQGIHYFSMGFVDGPPMSARIAEAPYPPREAAMIVQQLAEAVQYAHEQGVIHRDLKPGNVLIDSSGLPCITDFGLAKQTKENSSLTGTGFILGTPSYMPPEQATGRADLTREQADIYSLGAILYAALTGRPPFQADNALETLRQVVQQEPVPPRQLNPLIPIDLETICLKCLEKPLHRRYLSAHELAAELARFLNGQPILARPVLPYERLWKWCRRNPLVTALLATVAASLLIGTIVSTYFAVEADSRAKENYSLAMKNRDLASKETKAKELATANEQLALEQKRLALLEAANLALNEAENHCTRNEANVGLHWMVKAHELAQQAEDAELGFAARAMISGWLAEVPRLESVVCIDTSPIGRFGRDDATILVAQSFGENLRARIFDAASGEELDSFPETRLPGNFLTLSPDRTRAVVVIAGELRLWSLAKKAPMGEPMPLEGKPSSAAFNNDGTLLATANTVGEIRLWDGRTGEPRGGFSEPQVGPLPAVCRVCFTTDGKALWIVGSGKHLACRSVADGTPVREPFDLKIGGFTLGTCAHGRHLVISDTSSRFRIFDVRPDPPVLVRSINSQLEYDFAEHPNRAYLLAGGRGISNEARFHALVDRVPPRSAPLTAPATVTGVQLSATGATILASHFGGVELWRTPDTTTQGTPSPLTAPVARSRYFLEREELVTVAADDPRSIHWIDLNSRQSVRSLEPWEQPLLAMGTDDEGRVAVAVDESMRVIVFDLRAGTRHVLDGQTSAIPEQILVGRNGRSALFILPNPQPDPLAPERRRPELWSLDHRRLVPLPPEVRDPRAELSVFDLIGDRLALCSEQERTVYVVDASGGDLLASCTFDGPPTCAAFHPDGRRLLVGRGDSFIEICDLSGSGPPLRLGRHDAGMHAIVPSPDGKLIVTTGADHVVRVWDLERRDLAGPPIRNTGRVYGNVAFSDDGQMAAIYSYESQARLVHLRSGRITSPMISLFGNGAAEFGFAPDGTRFRGAVHHDQYSKFVIRPLPATPADSESLRLFVECWTGLTLDGHDVRVLPRDEWSRRRIQLQQLAPGFLPGGVAAAAGGE